MSPNIEKTHTRGRETSVTQGQRGKGSVRDDESRANVKRRLNEILLWKSFGQRIHLIVCSFFHDQSSVFIYIHMGCP